MSLLAHGNIHWANIFTSVGTVGAVALSLIIVITDNHRRGKQERRASFIDANSVTYEIYSPSGTREVISGFPLRVPAGRPGVKITNGGDRPIFEIQVEVSVAESEDDQLDRWHWYGGGIDGRASVLLAGETKLVEGYPAEENDQRAYPTIPSVVRGRIHPTIRWRDSDATRWEKRGHASAKRLARET